MPMLAAAATVATVQSRATAIHQGRRRLRPLRASGIAYKTMGTARTMITELPSESINVSLLVDSVTTPDESSDAEWEVPVGTTISRTDAADANTKAAVANRVARRIVLFTARRLGCLLWP